MQPDVIVVGSGGAGLLAACAAADAGAAVTVLEKSSLFGGTTAISGGGLWIPANHHMRAAGIDDRPEDAVTYLERVTLGAVSRKLLDVFVHCGPDMVEFIERTSSLRFSLVDRPDYHPDWPGARTARALEPLPYATDSFGPMLGSLRVSPTRAPVTFTESRRGIDRETLETRRRAGIRTQGAALVAGLTRACIDRGVKMTRDARVQSLVSRKDGRTVGVVATVGDQSVELRASKAVVLASGGFEWSPALCAAFLKGADCFPLTPPWAEGDGLLMGLKVGAAVANMKEAWWAPAISVPGERYDGRSLFRNIVRELALPGSLMVNRRGRRFADEASGYNDLAQAFHFFDLQSYSYVNVPAWLIFDDAFKRRYTVATIAPSEPAPDWFLSGNTLGDLALTAGIDADGLLETVTKFNTEASRGVDTDFARGCNAHDRFNGEREHEPNPCLGAVQQPPFYAVPIHPGNSGTKGGLQTDDSSRVLDHAGRAIPGLYACGDVAASTMGAGYAGAGASLGTALTFAFIAGRHCVSQPS